MKTAKNLGWALVTGATGGIGAEMCRQLAARGWSLVLAGRDQTRLEALAAELALPSERARIVTADLAAADGAQSLIEQVEALGVDIDMLVNNAGFGYTAPVAQSDAARQRAVVQVDVMTVVELCCAFAAPMAKRRHGSILNVASVAGTMPGPYMSTYFASKAFVLSFSQALHDELAPYGVHVMALCPGPTKTGFWQTAGTSVDYIKPLMPGPEWICRVGLAYLHAGRAVCAPGAMSKACYGFGRVVPAWASRKVAGLFNRG